MAKILVINGPNLNLLGTREPDIYGQQSLEDILSALTQQAKQASHELTHFQSNAEAELIERVQLAKSDNIDFIIINPAALTHTSIALRDAFLSVEIPFVEVHLSNIHAREEFRQQSYLADIAQGVICGLGPQGYSLALDYIIQQLES